MKLGKFKVSDEALKNIEVLRVLYSMNVIDKVRDKEIGVTEFLAISDYFDDIDTDPSMLINDQVPWYEFLFARVDGETKMTVNRFSEKE